MIFHNIIFLNKSKKVLIPGLQLKELKPIASLLHPSNIIIPLLAISIIAQLADNLKDVLSPKEIQRLPSVKVYNKIIYSGFNSSSLAAIVSLSKTLGPELEALSVLTVSERLNFLRLLQKKIIFSKMLPKVSSNLRNLYDPNELIKHRKGLSMQFKSSMVANSLFSFNSIVLGMSLPNVNLDCIIESSKILWLNLGLSIEEFDFLLRKQASNIIKRDPKFSKLFSVEKECDCLKILALSEFNSIMKFESFINFEEDIVIMKGENNLVLLESELRFIRRSIAEIPEEVFIPNNDLSDVILRTAYDQRKNHKLQVNRFVKNIRS